MDLRRRSPQHSAIVYPATQETLDRPLVAHAPDGVQPAGWPEGVAPDRPGRPRPSTYALWIDHQGVLHSALRSGRPEPHLALTRVGISADEILAGRLRRYPKVPQAPVRAVTYEIHQAGAVLGPVFWPAASEEPALDERDVLGVAASDARRRADQAPDPMAGWRAVLSFGLIAVWTFGFRVIAEHYGYLAGAGFFAVIAGLALVGRLYDRRRRQRLIEDAGAYEVRTSEAVELTVGVAGSTLAVGEAPGSTRR